MAERFTFQSEGRELLDLMIHSVYSNRDIFLRELISNASDALDKLRVESLTRQELSGLFADPHIRLEVDGKARTLSVEDSGVGMNREDLVAYIGTIARSGTKEFARILRDSREKTVNAEMIGQFGVGFYSSFMAADRVEIVTRRAGEGRAWRWSSSGDGTYEIEEAEREGCGTTVTLFLKAADEESGMPDYADAYVLRGIVKRYSDFVSYPIRMREDGKDEILNSMKAIWMRPEEEVSEEEYEEFYRHVSHDWGKPLSRIVFRGEGATSFRALLYVPGKAPMDLFLPEHERGVALYVRRVFILHDCKDLIPEYMRFVRGVVDSEDLSLNVSREILQKERNILAIRRSLTRKILDSLKSMLGKDREKYRDFWREFGAVLKEGIIRDEKNREAILGLALFSSTAGEPTTLSEYVSRMKSEQNEIFFLTGPAVAVASSPHLEAYRAKGYEVLLLSDPVDDFWTQSVTEFEGKPLRNAARGVAELGDAKARAEEKETMRAAEKRFRDLLDVLQKLLTDHVKEVRLSGRLTDSPACLVGDASDMSPQMERFLRAMGQDAPHVKRILEINPSHPVAEGLLRMHEEKEQEDFAEFAELLYGQALLAEGGQPADPTGFAKRLAALLGRAMAAR